MYYRGFDIELSTFEQAHIDSGGKLLVVYEHQESHRWHVVDVQPGVNVLPFGVDGFIDPEDANNIAYGLGVLGDVPALVRPIESYDIRHSSDYVQM